MASRSQRQGPVAAPPPALDSSPSRYIVRVSRQTGEEIEGPIDPDELLVHHHRDNHPVEVAAQFVASRVIQLTGNERLVRRGLRGLNTLGGAVAGAVGSAIGSEALSRTAKKLMGVVERDSDFQFREQSHLSESPRAPRPLGARQRAAPGADVRRRRARPVSKNAFCRPRA